MPTIRAAARSRSGSTSAGPRGHPARSCSLPPPRAPPRAAATPATRCRGCPRPSPPPLPPRAPPPPPTPADNDYRPQLAELGAGGGPTDIAVYDDLAQRRLILASTPNTGEIVVIDADTAQFRSIAIADPVDRILLFPSGDG